MAKKQKKQKGWKGQILSVFGLLTGVIFLPTSIILMVGMIPTLVCLLVDRTKGKIKTFTVGAMNAAGCSPFILELWLVDHSPSQALSIALQPMAIIVMFSAAAVGYLIDWAITNLISKLAYENALLRQKAIAKRQKALVERWGREVSGEIPLDPHGFPLEEKLLKDDNAEQEET